MLLPVRAIMIVSAFSLLGGCVSGPKRENDSALDYLNGHNYSARSGVGIVPFVKRQAPAMNVSGVLLVGADPLPVPLKYQTIVLTRGQSEVARAMTDSNGAFILAGEIPNGTYSITVDSGKYSASQVLEVSNYKTEGVRLVAIPKDH